MRAFKRVIVSLVAVFLVVMPLEVYAKTIEKEVNPYLSKIVDIRLSEETPENVENTNDILERLNKIDSRILENVQTSGVTLILSDLPMTEFDEFSYLKGVIPRGHTDPWDDIPGLGGFESYVRVGASEPGIENNHGDVNLELHEFGHIVDSFLVDGTTISQKDEFQQIHAEEHEAMFPNQPYFKYVEEYFAEAFAYYYLNDNTKVVLEARAPKTAAFIKSIHNKVSTITDIMSDGFTLYWDDFNADHYNVIVNDEVVKTTTNLSAVIEGLDPSTMYEVKVESVDKNDEVITTTYSETIYTAVQQDVDTNSLRTLLIEVGKIGDDNMTKELKASKEEASRLLDYTSDEDITQSDVDKATNELSEAYKIYQPRIMEKNVQGEENKFMSQESNVKTMPKNTTWIVILSVSFVLIILAIVYLYYTGREEE
ncbi:fibronectin type III domain-containing protein [Nosocomiicoccus sp. HMSC09A07]|uniref:anthrax toxin lethal factor-related metalloendopeptidase n=1 Tax=Nosocomiicoccus sp. HMSC09A07 TaxID=1581145 RepID=UPI0008A1968B|nr:fibronectin type III domain-containing protein [Nosocomiicoccus sp. HMSC09A07]OFS61336.1 hypothetical protein HMPREF3177_08100 [Nosocomiicoccus sp. HMSC09A07]